MIGGGRGALEDTVGRPRLSAMEGTSFAPPRCTTFVGGLISPIFFRNAKDFPESRLFRVLPLLFLIRSPSTLWLLPPKLRKSLAGARSRGKADVGEETVCRTGDPSEGLGVCWVCDSRADFCGCSEVGIAGKGRGEESEAEGTWTDEGPLDERLSAKLSAVEERFLEPTTVEAPLRKDGRGVASSGGKPLGSSTSCDAFFFGVEGERGRERKLAAPAIVAACIADSGSGEGFRREIRDLLCERLCGSGLMSGRCVLGAMVADGREDRVGTARKGQLCTREVAQEDRGTSAERTKRTLV